MEEADSGSTASGVPSAAEASISSRLCTRGFCTGGRGDDNSHNDSDAAEDDIDLEQLREEQLKRRCITRVHRLSPSGPPPKPSAPPPPSSMTFPNSGVDHYVENGRSSFAGPSYLNSGTSHSSSVQPSTSNARLLRHISPVAHLPAQFVIASQTILRSDALSSSSFPPHPACLNIASTRRSALAHNPQSGQEVSIHKKSRTAISFFKCG